LRGQSPKFSGAPVALRDSIIAPRSARRHVVPALAAKAERARIGRYYATGSMLVPNPETGLYDENATPSTGTHTLKDHYAQVIAQGQSVNLGEHAVF